MSSPIIQPIPYRPPTPAPRQTWLERINWRILVFAAVVICPVLLLFYVWLSEKLTGGIHDYGTYKEVDLKAMSTFDMDGITGVIDDVPGRFRALEGQHVLLIGQVWAPATADDDSMRSFTLVYSIAKCCYGGPPRPQCAVECHVMKGRKAYYPGQDQVKVWGTLHVSIHRDSAGSAIASVYQVDVNEVDPVQN